MTTRAQIDAQADQLRAAMIEAGISRTITTEDYAHPYMGTWANGEARKLYPMITIELTAEHVIIEAGSPTYGRAWRIFYRSPVGGGHFEMSWSDYLGWTKDEAFATLRALGAGIRATLRAGEKN